MSQIRLPSDKTLKYAAKIAITDDKPVQMDYWSASIDKSAFIGIKKGTENQPEENLLVKSNEEYTSTIRKRYKSDNEFIILTENTIYIVSSDIESQYVS
jgi:hypothetical protein